MFGSFNLATHVGDSDEVVQANRSLLIDDITETHQLAQQPTFHWLNQTHSNKVYHAGAYSSSKHSADASISSTRGQACVVLTADCLPILLCDKNGTHVAAIHAGWRGIASNIIENTVAELIASISASHRADEENNTEKNQKNRKIELVAWMGPAIGPSHFQVRDDMRKQFESSEFLNAPIRNKKLTSSAFHIAINDAFVENVDGSYHCDIFQLATAALKRANVHLIYGGGICTSTNTDRYYSFRQNAKTGRFASFILLK